MLQCEKLLWLDKYMPEKTEYSQAVKRRFAAGSSIGELAKRIFGKYYDATAVKSDGSLDIRKMKENTRKAVTRGEDVICEAAFDSEGLYCAVDILKKTKDGWAIYEVKSSLHVKSNYISDAAYQRYVLGKVLNITGCYIITLNGDYVRHGELDMAALFRVHDISVQVGLYQSSIAQNINRARDVLSVHTEPSVRYGRQCRQPYECPFINYCQGSLTEPSAFDLYGCNKNDWADKGYRTMRDVVSGGELLTDIQKRQIEYVYNDLPVYVDKDGVSSVLQNLRYPLYFIDFESSMPEVPAFDGASPYMILPFMYSLHYIEKRGGELKHTQFLSEAPDPRREVAEALVRDMPAPGSIIAYNASFEQRVVAGFAAEYPDVKGLENAAGNFIDLLDVFKGGFVYNKEMGGSFSLKSVVTALFPNDAALDYSALGLVRDGHEAMALYAELPAADKDRHQEIIDALFAYCKLDTLSLVKITEKLIGLIGL